MKHCLLTVETSYLFSLILAGPVLEYFTIYVYCFPV